MAVGIENELGAYSEWRKELASGISNLKTWLQGQDMGEAQVERRLEHVLSTLRDDRLYIAFVAEFSRGKSELINAIFFGGVGQRVLPSGAGRTTMCPTELFFDPAQEPSLRLLPIETRANATALADYKGFLEEWKTFPLDLDAPSNMAEALSHIAETKVVPREAAQSYGLHVAEREGDVGMPLRADGLVEVPSWRHAMINLPHPLLKQGLVILDTPGLNALGAEPELTLSMLPSAHAVLFILAADTGVTKSDIQVWQEYIQGTRGGAQKGRLVVLNKIDGLWDELRASDEIDREIRRQIEETARHLGVPAQAVLPVSAQKGLIGKVRNDSELLRKSGIPALEEAIARELLPEKRNIIGSNIVGDMDEIQRSLYAVMDQRLRGVHEHMDELSSLTGKNMDVIENMMTKVKVDKEHFEKSLQRFQATRSIFALQTNRLYEHLDLQTLDKLASDVKHGMEDSMTTSGIRASMEGFFSGVATMMQGATRQAHEIKDLMDGVYRKFQEEHGLTDIRPSAFSVMKYVRELKRLETKHEQAMRGMSLVLTEQRVVVRKFFGTAVSRARAIFVLANQDAEAWLRNLMAPMESQVREHHTQLRRRLESIKRIYKASSTLEDRLAELKHVEEGHKTQQEEIRRRFADILRTLEASPPALGTDHRASA